MSPTEGQIAYALLTRPPLGLATPFDLHVLSTPPAFVLSQDQTLRKEFRIRFGALDGPQVRIPILGFASPPEGEQLASSSRQGRTCYWLLRYLVVKVRRNLRFTD